MGDEPCEVDCSIFGMLSVVKRSPTGSPYVAAVEGKVISNVDVTVWNIRN